MVHPQQSARTPSPRLYCPRNDRRLDLRTKNQGTIRLKDGSKNSGFKFLPILVFSVSAAFRLFRCHFVKSHQSHSPLCSFFNLQKHTQKKSENQLDIIFRTTLKGNSKSKTHNSSLITHNSLLTAHRSLSNIFTFVHKPDIGFKMNKNRLK